MKTRRALSSIATLLMLVVATLGSAEWSAAYQRSVEGLEFTGTGFLDTFPCPVGTLCSGSFQGTVNGEMTGLDGEIPWTVSVALGSSEATFLYTDECPEPIGFATGSGTLRASAGGAPIGTYGPDPAGPPGLPVPIIEVDAPFTFSWTRVGTAAFLSLWGTARVLILRPVTGPEWRTVAANYPGVGTAAFVPTTGEVHGCGDPEGLTAFIVGGDVFAA